MGKKLTIEYIREQFEKEGYKLLSKKYVGAHIKLKYVCSKGHRHNITWNNWSNGRRCPYCAGRPHSDCWHINKQLVIHHIDYIKKHCNPWNLITLCRSCNGRANKNRKWHTSYYTEIMIKRGLSHAVQLNS
ncbi:hypothetical protein LCGC14_0470240 [marine sediment metagenome]|uniref:CapR homology domain-containing protein n=1 Tax=marine sediment metagenome TaxID=412755 RepID=A0A0F9SCF9_9ZZZZ